MQLESDHRVNSADLHTGNWFRAYGNENREFNADGLMQRRFASIKNIPIEAKDRKFR